MNRGPRSIPTGGPVRCLQGAASRRDLSRLAHAAGASIASPNDVQHAFRSHVLKLDLPENILLNMI